MPITVNIIAVDHPDQTDKLNVSVDRKRVFLSRDDLDEIRWVCNRGNATVIFAPANNPFDPNTSTGGTYQLASGGSSLSGSVNEIVVDTDPDVFREFEYNIFVVDGPRSGVADPHVRVRQRRVYKAGA
jgi:hypothetical protein